MDCSQPESRYRWYILILAAVTICMTVAVPGMCMSVLFDEISDDLGLSLAQVGVIWGIGALPGVVMGLIGGALGDRYGPRRILVAACFVVGLTGALRGFATDFYTLAAAVFLMGFVSSVVPMSIFKTCGIWFSRQQLGLANGVISMGMALGFMTSSLISATLLSPWLGGWRHVLILYGLIAMALTIPWALARPAPITQPTATQLTATPNRPSLRQTIGDVARVRQMWLLGWAILGIGGCIQGTLGYLPLYLRDMGWTDTSADAAAASFHLASLVLVIPIALWSDRLGTRRKVLLAGACMVTTGVGLLSVADGLMVWAAVIMAGMVRDGFMAVFMTMIIETDGIGPAYAGTATGLVMVFSGLGNLLSPPLGNSLAAIDPGLSFVFWAGMALTGSVGLYLAQDRRADAILTVQPTG